MYERYLRNITSKWKNLELDSFDFLGLTISQNISFKDLVGLGLIVSFLISFAWNFIFFYNIKSIPSSTDGLALWFFMGIVVFGCYFLIALFGTMLVPNIISANIKFSNNMKDNIRGHLILIFTPYYLSFFLFSSFTKTVKILAIGLFLILIFSYFHRHIFKEIKKIVSFLTVSFILIILIYVILDQSVVKEKRSFGFICVSFAIIIFANMTFVRRQKRGENIVIITLVTALSLFMIFMFTMPIFKDGYFLNRTILKLPYNYFHVGYYNADIIVNKESYDMFKKITGKPELTNSNNETHEIKNTFILFSMGDEYIIEACVEKVDKINKKIFWLGEKAKYRHYILKASKNKDILPSTYTFEKEDWTSLYPNVKEGGCPKAFNTLSTSIQSKILSGISIKY